MADLVHQSGISFIALYCFTDLFSFFVMKVV